MQASSLNLQNLSAYDWKFQIAAFSNRSMSVIYMLMPREWTATHKDMAEA